MACEVEQGIRFGRFRESGRTFWGRVEGRTVEEWNGAPFAGAGSAGRKHALEDVVVEVPAGVQRLLLFETDSGDSRWLPASSVVPHRTMVAIPHVGHRTSVRGGVGWVMGGPAHRVNDREAGRLLAGWTPCLIFRDEDVERLVGGRGVAGAFRGFVAAGPWVVWGGAPEAGLPSCELWHNGDLIHKYNPASGREGRLAVWADAVGFEAGDLIIESGPPAGAGVAPGDHVELRAGGWGSVAVNMGMRGSA